MALAAQITIIALYSATALTGPATIIDGDTLEISGRRVRLWGIDAPETSQLCNRAAATYQCGRDAAQALTSHVEGRTITCSPQGHEDRYRRIVAVCRLEGSDLGGWMVLQGLAVDYPRYSQGAYAPEEETARKAKAGLWSGSFTLPWLWRSSRSSRF